MVLGRQDYQWRHEPVLYGWKPTASHKWYSDRKQTTVWNFDRPMRSEDHPTMKPVDLITYPLLNSSKKNDILLDPFGGAGSTLIACEKNKRICYMMELSPRYCDVIIRRWQELTGKDAVLEPDGGNFDNMSRERLG
jgi:site-specific DNA-methyltransferase (adenine-specific)